MSEKGIFMTNVFLIIYDRGFYFWSGESQEKDIEFLKQF